MPTISAQQILAAVPNALSLLLPEDWFAEVPDDVNVFETLYRWIAANRELNIRTLHSRTYVGAALYKRLLAAERRRIAKRKNLRGQELEEALAFSDVGSGPHSLIGERTLRGDALVIIPEGDDESLRALARDLMRENHESTIRRIREHASGRNFSEWLVSNATRPDPVGHLADDVKVDLEFPRDSPTYQAYQRYLTDNSASRSALKALSDAWLEYWRQYPERVTLCAWCAACERPISDLAEGSLVLTTDGEFEARHDGCLKGEEEDSLNLTRLLRDDWYDTLEDLAERHTLTADSVSAAERLLRLWGFGARDPAGGTRIYFVQAGTSGPIKIGYTAGPVGRRVRALQTAHPDTLRLLAELEGNRGDEAALHRRFAAHRRQGEWFAPHPELIEFIAVIRRG